MEKDRLSKLVEGNEIKKVRFILEIFLIIEKEKKMKEKVSSFKGFLEGDIER